MAFFIIGFDLANFSQIVFVQEVRYNSYGEVVI